MTATLQVLLQPTSAMCVSFAKWGMVNRFALCIDHDGLPEDMAGKGVKTLIYYKGMIKNEAKIVKIHKKDKQ